MFLYGVAPNSMIVAEIHFPFQFITMVINGMHNQFRGLKMIACKDILLQVLQRENQRQIRRARIGNYWLQC